jgi:penicillin-binding protein 2A
MDDFRKVSMRSGYSPMPPRSRSERVGPRSRSGGRGTGGPGKRGKKAGWRRFFTWKWFLLVLLTSFLLMVGGCSAIMMSANPNELNKVNKNNIAAASKIYAYNNKQEPVDSFGYDNREWISMDELLKHNKLMVNTFVKTEDRRFYQHHGVDFQGLARAVVKDVISMGKAEGASTITQQVCKNIVLENSAKTYTRKIKEIGCALNLERTLKEEGKDPKKQILEAYLNYISFGGNIAGVQMAAKSYFGYDLKKQELPVQDAAMLAGMPKGPSLYNPIRHKEKALERRNVILTQVMPVDDVMPPLISQAEADKLAQTPLNPCENCAEKYAKKSDFDAYKDLIQKELKEEYGIDPDDLATGSYQIYTALDPKAQGAVQEALKKDSLFTNASGTKLTAGGGKVDADAGITVIDPKTGGIRAIGGGRNFVHTAHIRALELHQPGSSIKPLTVYSPAIEKHDYNEYSIVHDKPVDWAGTWHPQNYEPGSFGDIRMEKMVEESYNLSTLNLLHDVVTLPVAFEYAQKLGLNLVPNDQAYAALGLGGLTNGVNTVQMAGAYSVFPNGGYYYTPHAIVKVVDADGDVRKRKHPIEDTPTNVFSKKTAYYMTRMLKKVVSEGTGSTFAGLHNGWDVAGKTGTINGEKSGWFVGYTPDLVCAVDVFYPGYSGDDYVKMTGGTAPAKIFSYVMKKLTDDKPPKHFSNFGVPDPQPPFELHAPHLTAVSQEDGVLLQWQAQPNRVKYQVFRDGQMIAELGPGSTSYKDTDAKPPAASGGDGGDGGFWDKIIGGGAAQSKSYTYKVVAIDTQATDPGAAQKESNSVTVTLSPKKPENPDPNGNTNDQNGQNGQNGNDQNGQNGGQNGNNPGGIFNPPPSDGGQNGGGTQDGGGQDGGSTGGNDKPPKGGGGGGGGWW